MNVKCTKCRYKFEIPVRHDGGAVEVVCPRCGHHQVVQLPEQAPAQTEIVPNKVVPSAGQPVTLPPLQAGQAQEQPRVEQPRVEQPMGDGGYQQEAEQPVIIYQESKSNNQPLLIAVIALLVVAIAGFVWLLSQRNNSASADVPLPASQDVETVDTTAVDAVMSTEVAADTAAMQVVDDVPVSSEFEPPYTYSGISNFCQLQFDIEQQISRIGQHISSFGDIKRRSKIRGRQMIYEHSDGVRYQLFFDESVNSSMAILTGIAISRSSSDPYGDCLYMDGELIRRGYDEWSTHLYYSGSSEMFFSPGCKGGRVYSYIYMSNALDKGAAPRD